MGRTNPLLNGSTTYPEFRLGPWMVQPSLNTISRNNTNLRLELKAIEVLVYLAQHSPQVVSKEQLIQGVWGDTFVTDDVLTRCVSELRKALEDDAKEPRIIQTIPKRGYRLLVKAKPVTPPSPPNKLHVLIRAGIVLMLCMGAPATILWMVNPAVPAIASTKQVTFTAEGKLAPILTDGSRLFFDQGGLVQMSISGGEVVPIRSSLDGMSALDVSPDGSDLLVVKPDIYDEDGKGYLYALPTLGGSPRRIGAIQATDARWSPNGKSILYCNGRSLYVVNSDGTNPRKIWEAASAIAAPVYSPDRRKIRATVYGVNPQSARIWELDADGGNAHPITQDWPGGAGQCCGQWSPDGKHYVFLSNRDGKTDVFELVPPSLLTLFKSPAPVKLTQTVFEISAVSLSRDSSRLFVIGSADQGAMLAYDPKTKRFVPFLAGMPAVMMDVSPDGQWIVYKTYPQESIWKCRVDGTERVQLATLPFPASIPRWSPDGKKIVFHEWLPKGPKLFVVSAEGGDVEEVVPGALNNDMNQLSGSWAGDGKSVAYGEYPIPGTGAKGIHVWNFTTHTGSILPGSEGYYWPAWSPDGRWLIAVHPNPSRFMLYSPVTKAWTDFGESPKDFNWWVWSRNSKFIYYTAKDGVYRIPLSTGKSEFFASFKDVKLPTNDAARVISMTPKDMPAIMSDTSVQQIYSLEWNK